MSSRYHMELRIFIETSCSNNIHTREKFFAAAIFESLWIVSLQTDWKKAYYGLHESSLHF